MPYGTAVLRVVMVSRSPLTARRSSSAGSARAGLGARPGFFEGLGFRNPLQMAVLAGAAELGGLAFAAGFVTPLAATGLAAAAAIEFVVLTVLRQREALKAAGAH